jgi:uncharacterized protein (TIGR02001 family)
MCSLGRDIRTARIGARSRLMRPRCLQAPVFAIAAALATAHSRAAGTFGGSLALTSDYVYQGLSQTCGHPAAQADLYLRTARGESASESFIGVWGSWGLGSTPCDEAREINAYAGHTFALSQSSNLSLSYVHYAFPGGSFYYGRLDGLRYDYDELDATWSYQDRLYLTASWIPDALGYSHDRIEYNRTAGNYGAQVHQPLVGSLTLSVGAGYDEVYDPSGVGYVFWNAGLEYTLGKVQLTASYFRTAARAERLFGPYVAGGRGAATVVWSF